MKTNNRILQEIALQIETGNPLWGVLFMNEYLTDGCWLRKAFVARAKHRLTGTTSLTSSALVAKLLKGVKAADLSEEERLSIGSRHVPSQRFVPNPRPTQERPMRVVTTQSNGTRRRF